MTPKEKAEEVIISYSELKLSDNITIYHGNNLTVLSSLDII